jgi:hypothetical protein
VVAQVVVLPSMLVSLSHTHTLRPVQHDGLVHGQTSGQRKLECLLWMRPGALRLARLGTFDSLRARGPDIGGCTKRSDAHPSGHDGEWPVRDQG